MIIDVTSAKQNVGKEFKFKNSIGLDNLTLVGLGINPLGDVVIDGVYFALDNSEIQVDAVAKVFFETKCSRCGAKFVKEYNFTVCETFVANPQNEEYVLENNKINLKSAIYDNFLMQFPSVLLCREDCAGLCDKCGQNLNYASCDCDKIQEEDTNNPFSVLKQLKK